MPAGLAEVVAPLAQRGQNVIDGDIEVAAGSRIARIKGLVASGFAAMPPGTFFGNLFDTVEPGRPFDGNIIAGDGLTFDLHIKNGPFPEIVGEKAEAFPASATTVTHTLATVPILKDRVVIGTQHNGANAVTTPTGYVLLANVLLTDSTVSIFERKNCDGTEGLEVDITASVAGAVLVKSWVIRYSNPAVASQTATGISPNTSDTSNNIGNLTPTWGIANNLWLTFIGIEADAGPPNITAFPGGFSGSGELQNISGTASLDGAIGWAFFNARLTNLDPSAYTYGPARSAAFLVAIPPREAYAINATPGGGAGWDDVLLVDNHSGASNPIIDALQHIEFGAGTMPASGQIRTDSPWEARGTKDMDVTAGEAIHLHSVDSSEFVVSAGSLTIQSDLSLHLISDTSDITLVANDEITATCTNKFAITSTANDIELNTTTKVSIPTGFMQFRGGTQPTTGDIRSNSASPFRIFTLNALELFSSGYNWINAGDFYVYTNLIPRLQISATGEWNLGASFLPGSAGQLLTSSGALAAPTWSSFTLAQLPTQATDTFLANVSGATATPAAVNLSTLAGAGLSFGTHTLDVTAGAGGSIVVTANDVQRGALTGAITASQDSNTTAFGAAAAKSVLANATNASAVPAFLGGTAAFQHLRVNSGNTGLEWSVFTTGDFPNNSVPITALATIATDTFLANVTAGTATPTAVNLSTLAGAGLNFAAHTLDVNGSTSITITSDQVQRAALTGAIAASLNSNATLFSGILDNTVAENDRTSLDFTSSTSITLSIADDSVNDKLVITAQRAALTGDVTATANSNATAFRSFAANTLLANATAAGAVPSDLAIATESVVGRTSGNLQAITSSVQSILMRAAGSVFWGTAAADQVLRRSGTGDLGFGKLVTNNIGNNQVTNGLLAQMATDTFKGNISGATADASDVAFSSIDSTSIIYDGASHTFQRAALTGDVTASQNSNATTIANGVVTNAKLATAAANTIKGNITGATASPTDNSLSATLDALVSSNQRVFLGRDATGWGQIFQTDGIAHMNLPTVGNACVVPWVDEDFRHLVVTTLGSSSGFPDVFVAITNGQSSGWYFGPESGGSATCSAVADTAGHNGIVQLATGASSGNDVTLFNGQLLRFDRTSFGDFWVKLSATTSVTLRIGFTQLDTAASGGTDSAMFQFDPAVSANYQCITRSASGTATTTTTSIAGSTLWKKFTIWRENSTSVKFFINNTLVATHTTAIPSIALTVGCYLKANAAVVGGKIMQIDRIRVYADDATLLT